MTLWNPWCILLICQNATGVWSTDWNNITFYVQKYIEQLTDCSGLPLVRDGPLGRPHLWKSFISDLVTDMIADFGTPYLAFVPLTVFWSNSKLNQNLERSSSKYAQPITTQLCTCHYSYTVVTCEKFWCDQPNKLWTRALQKSIEFRIRSKHR